MNGPVYTFARGEPVIIGRRVLSGDPSGFTLIAALKPVPAARKAGARPTMPPASVASLGDFAVELVAASNAVAAHWLLTWPGELAVGDYCTDGKFLIGSAVAQVTRPCWIAIVESVSG